MDKITKLKSAFEKALETKIIWGRNELKTMFDGLCLNITLEGEILDQLQGKGRANKISSNVEVTDVTIKPTEKTGELKFQFDDEDSETIAPVMDFHPVSITLAQQKPYHGMTINNKAQSNISFKSKTGKRFKLFIDDKVS